MLFQGEEWGASTPFLYFTDHDAELGRAVTEGRRREFAYFAWDPEQIPDPQSPETHRRSVLRWDERTSGEHAQILDWYRTLIALRRTEPSITDPGIVTEVTVESGVVSQRRGPITVVANLGSEPARPSVPGDVVLGYGMSPLDGGPELAQDGVAVFVTG